MKCDFCKKEGNWNMVLRNPEIVKKDGFDVILCDECINHYANGEYEKIKLK
jgi:2-polyprenyl-3-methyl-5-hydroxy-6-metoxy-1,4-benzoquinol methylase